MALLLGLAMLPAGAIAMQVGLNAVAAREAAYEESLSRRALQSITVERGLVDEVREMLRVLATTPQLQQIESGDCRAWLGDIVARYEYLSALAISSADGRVLCSVPAAAPGMQTPDSALRRKTRARGAFSMSFIERGALSGRPVLGAMTPIQADGRLYGYVGASISVTELTRVLERGRIVDNVRIALVDDTGRIIAESTPEHGAPPGLPSAAQVRNHLGADPAFVRMPDAGAMVVPLHAPDLYAVMSWAPTDAERWRRWGGIAVSITAPLLIWLIAIGAGWFAIEVFVARPLSDLEGTARALARGEDVVDAPALRSAPAEIRSLRRTLAAMAKTLRGREQRLVEALVQERALLREVHHRVKNNLQMVASLLNIQARAAPDESEAHGLARAHDRVQLLALVHQRLYTAGLHDIRLDELGADIARQLVQSRGAQSRDVKLDLELSETHVDADRAVPCAFLMGETLLSLLDAAGEEGSVALKLSIAGEDEGVIRFAIEADAAQLEAAAPSTGGRLIEAFARQLGANIGWGGPERGMALWAFIPPPPPRVA
ncbi:MAG: histidine kinase dimerization/phosphoacceptor domain -containing protein [Hyphomonadaceae bacterium]